MPKILDWVASYWLISAKSAIYMVNSLTLLVCDLNSKCLKLRNLPKGAIPSG